MDSIMSERIYDRETDTFGACMGGVRGGNELIWDGKDYVAKRVRDR